MKEYEPLVTIVTVCLNSEQHIEQTLLSVIGQSYQNVEFIVIDGQSSDRTLNIIRKYEHRITFWTSEKDHGVFDAMNKGTKYATGDYLCFLNSDDYFYSEKSVEYAVCKMKEGYQFIYGKGCLLHGKRHKIVMSEQLANRDLLFRDIIHPSIFCDRRLFEKYGNFNLKYKFASDYEFIVKCFLDNAVRKSFVGQIIAVYRIGGLSSKKHVHNALKEKDAIVRRYFSWRNYLLYKAYFHLCQYPFYLLAGEFSATVYYKSLVDAVKKLLSFIGIKDFLDSEWCDCDEICYKFK